MNPHVILVEYEMYSCLFIFQYFGKIPDGYQIAEIGAVRLVINQSVVPVEQSLHLKTGVVFPLFVI
jgi:hypothetical protein